MPTSATFAGSTLGAEAEHPRQRSGPTPTQQASGIPCTLPLGLDCGVFISACASIQSKPIFAIRFAEETRHAGYRADRDRVIAAEHQRHFSVGQRLRHQLAQTLARRRDLREILRIARALRRPRSPPAPQARSEIGDVVAERARDACRAPPRARPKGPYRRRAGPRPDRAARR